MSNYSFIADPARNRSIILNRVIVGGVLIGLGILVLLSRLIYLQIIEHKKYTTLSDRNQLRIEPISPARGLIYDRNDKLLARNLPAFNLGLVPERVSNLTATLDQLEKILPITLDERQAFLKRVKRNPRHQQQILKYKLNEEEVSRFAVNQYRFVGVNLAVDLIRDYPYGALLGHVLGYVSEANKQELAQRKQELGTLQVGKIGLEKFYEFDLQGQPGYQQLETDVLGRQVQTLKTSPPQAGKDLKLTLDINLQAIAMQALGESKGAVVALDPTNGEILALVSNPSFDPNQFVKGIDKATYSALQKSPLRPLFNRALQGQYPPASTIKPVFGLGGLVTQKISPYTRIFDPGWYQINNNGRQYRDWQEKGHGWTNLDKSIRESCDVFYYILAEKMGIQQLSYWMNAVGLGKLTGIDLPGERQGLVPSLAWKRKMFRTTWYPGETLITGIGQGYTLATPLQLAIMGSYLANRGEAFKPHLNIQLKPEKLPSMRVEKRLWPFIIKPMTEVISSEQGTAYRYFTGLNIPVAGKTGTAQVYGLKENEKYNHDSVAQHLRDHSLFIAFAPVDKPRIVVSVILENQKASPIVARNVIQAYLRDAPHAKEPEL